MSDHHQQQLLLQSVVPEIPIEIQTFFGLALAGWIATYLFYYNYRGKEAFAKAFVLHDFHAIGACVLAAMSIGINDEAKFSEFLLLAFTLAYFIVDFVDCILQRHLPYFFHALLSILLVVGCGCSPIHRSYRSGSRGALTELSTYHLHKWQSTKQKSDFITFFVLFAICRILWIPYFVWGVYRVSGLDYQVVGAICIFLLNLFWFFKMIPILKNYDTKRSDAKKKTQ